MRGIEQELIWQGRLQLGDEPGVYGDATYVGLKAELPFTLYHNADSTGSEKILLTLEAIGVNTYGDYQGHLVTLFGFFLDDPSKYTWRKEVIPALPNRLKEDVLQLTADLTGLLTQGNRLYLSLEVAADLQVTPDYILILF